MIVVCSFLLWRPEKALEKWITQWRQKHGSVPPKGWNNTLLCLVRWYQVSKRSNLCWIHPSLNQETWEILVFSLLDPAAAADPAASCPNLCFCLGGRFTGDCGIWSEIRMEAVGWPKINYGGHGNNWWLWFQGHDKLLRVSFLVCF